MSARMWMWVLLLVHAGAAGAAEPWVPYDNFNPSEPSPPRAVRVRGIDWSRWGAREVGAGTERVRKQAGLQLRLQQRTTEPDGAYGLAFLAPSKVTAIEVKARVVKARAPGCEKEGEVAAQVGGRFFNSGLWVSPGSAHGDVQAWLRLVRRSTDAAGEPLLSLEALVERCDDAACTQRTPLFSKGLGKVREEEVSTLRVVWDAAGSAFEFQRDAQTPLRYAYAYPRASSPGAPLKSLEVVQRAPDCAAASGLMNAYFFDVKVNEGAAPAP